MQFFFNSKSIAASWGMQIADNLNDNGNLMAAVVVFLSNCFSSIFL